MERHNFSYIKGAAWFVAALFIGALNDVIVQHLSHVGLDPFTLVFFRLAIGSALLLPWIFFDKSSNSPTWIHLFRGLLTFLAVLAWIHGMSRSSVVTATLANFTMPIVAFLLAPLFLGERPTLRLGVVLLLGFFASMITLSFSEVVVNSYLFFFIFSIVSFVLLDVLAKKYLLETSPLAIIFYGNSIATLCAFLPFYYYGALPPKQTWALLLILGIGSNLLLFSLFRAYAHSPLTLLSPLRYLEIVISIVLNYLCFSQKPTLYEWWGMAIILPVSLLVVFFSSDKRQRFR